MSRTLTHLQGPVDCGGWLLFPGRTEPRELTLCRDEHVVRRLRYSGYAGTRDDLLTVDRMTETVARTLAEHITVKVTGLETHLDL